VDDTRILEKEDGELIAEALRAQAKKHSGRAGYAGRYDYRPDTKQAELDKAKRLRELAEVFEWVAD